MHDRFRDALFFVLMELPHYANPVSSAADVVTELTGLLLPRPNFRPTDVTLRLLPGVFPHASTWQPY
jgi:hypothetical protein